MGAEPSPQLTLFDADRPERPARDSYREMMAMQPAARRSDPSGSVAAAERLQQSGLGGRQRRAVFLALRERQGATSKELAEHMACDRYTPARRLVELERAGWVCRGRRRTCRVSGIKCVTWYLGRSSIQKPQSRAQVPCKSQGHWATASPHGATEPGSATTTPERVTTPEQRRRLLEEAARTDEKSRALLMALEGGGGQNHGDP